ncbi:unnamed protein product [Tilletia laevis]|uniref:PH domain-containing protein n=2 Tax=Tilletia TaxID=13289 RepID=A0A177VGK7_9BASI|nr:hypothetical protein CF336_g4786 [Tilletia laevis]KAE8259205.1 hypothetical protein A4X03_0g4156 [Tilletia caries]KAE8200645.1 hypothetical protein CF335_g3914 [Tilletia laevis]CAD6885064.1 unnamed protein product [Tilletia caries]CAD6899730.1 unnamed protein product [Tilletia laevis]
MDGNAAHSGAATSPNYGPPSPEITTRQILGASSSGWSPQRQVNRKFVPLGSGGSSQPANGEEGSPRKSFAVLKSHSLVSNSVFRQGPAPISTAAAVAASTLSHTPSPPSPSKNNMGVGLGIDVNSTPVKGTITPRLGPAFTPRKMSGERVGSGSHAVDAENQAPNSDVFVSRTVASMANARKSKGIDALAKGSHVSNSPFKQSVTNSPFRQISSPDAGEKPLQPRNAWAMMAEAQASSRNSPGSENGKPTRPLSFQSPASAATLQGRMYQSPELVDDHNTTPRSSHHTKSASVDHKDNASRGLLVSNRLHGPRQMSTSVPSQEDTESRHERRKTVTFDEILEVQEFDKESSFDRESTRSEGSGLSQGSETPLSDMGQWLNHDSSDLLQVVNGPINASPASSTSEELPQLVPSSGSSSSDASTFDELPDIALMPPSASHQPHFLQHSASLASIPSVYSEDVSYDPGHVFVDRKSPGPGDESFTSLNGLHRVDSLVDELLSGDILNTSPTLDEEVPRRRSARPHSISQPQHASEPVSRALPVPPVAADSRLSINTLPDIPNWSPFVMQEGASSDPELPATPFVAPDEDVGNSSPSRSAGGRPRITRDAVLERVRAAKQEETIQQLPGGSEHQQHLVSISQSHTAALVDLDMMARHHAVPRTSSTPNHMQNEIPQRPAPIQNPSYEARAAPAPSPVRHAVKMESPLDRLSAEVAAEHDEMRRSSQDDGQNYLQAPAMSPDEARSSSGRASPSSALAPPPPPVTPGEQADRIIARRRTKNNGGSSRKRSLSAGDAAQEVREARDEMEAEDVGDDSFFARHRLTPEEEMESRASIGADLAISKAMLDQSLKTGLNVPFTTGMEQELKRIYKDTDARYNTVDRGVIKGVDDKVQTTSAGDIDSGRAWRRLRRPSDMNEYAQELREIRESNSSNKPLGKIFVMVDSFIPAQLPIPSRPTRFYCVLDNGLHMVKTGVAPLRAGGQLSPIGQEFELIQHKNLEFSFTLVAVRDPHLVEPSKAPLPLVNPKKQKSSPSLAKGVSRLFGSPKKQASKLLPEASSIGAAPAYQTEPMIAFMNREGAFGRVRVLFEELQDRCLGTCATFDCAVMGVAEPMGSISAASRLVSLSSNSAAFEENLNKVRGKLRLKIFYLPPIPNIPRDLLPDSLEECIHGMQAAVNQKVHVWMSGTLTQNGGDCRSWRRRPVQAQGVSLICFNEITRRPIVKIDLSKAVAIEDNYDPVDPTLVSPNGASTAASATPMQRTASSISTSAFEDADENYNVERSFVITFGNGERISFFADTDEEKDKWLAALRDVVGKPSPVAPLWAHAANDLIRRVADGRHQFSSGAKSEPANTLPASEPQASTRQSSTTSRPSQWHRPAEAAIPEEQASTPTRPTAGVGRPVQPDPSGSAPMQRATTEQQPSGRRIHPEQRPVIPPRSFTQDEGRRPVMGAPASSMATPEHHHMMMAAATTGAATPVRQDRHKPMPSAPNEQTPVSAGRGRGTAGAVARRPVPMQ